MKELIHWLITSSANPEKVGLTVKGLLLGVVPVISMVAPVLCALVKVCIDLALVNPFIDGVVGLVVAGCGVISAVMVILGLIRKVQFGRWSAN